MFRDLARFRPPAVISYNVICYFFVNSAVVLGAGTCHPEFLPNHIYPGLLICVFADLAEGEI